MATLFKPNRQEGHDILSLIQLNPSNSSYTKAHDQLTPTYYSPPQQQDRPIVVVLFAIVPLRSKGGLVGHILAFISTTRTRTTVTLLTFHKIVRSPLTAAEMEIDTRNEFENNESSKSTPYFTPLGKFDENRSQFEYPLPSPGSVAGEVVEIESKATAAAATWLANDDQVSRKSPGMSSSVSLLKRQNLNREEDATTEIPKANKGRSKDEEDRYLVQRSSPAATNYSKNGEYFRFPEVDLFSPNISCQKQTFNDVKSDISEGHNRRVRLKSISLDSDGAKLVEDNLGIPVEELFDITRPSTSTNDKNISISSFDSKQDDDDGGSCSCFDELHEVTVNRKAQKNKPTTTVQKAISFDSFDDSSKVHPSSFFMARRLSDFVVVEYPREYTTGSGITGVQKAISLMHISTRSISMPSTPILSPKKNFNAGEIHQQTKKKNNKQQLGSSLPLTPYVGVVAVVDHHQQQQGEESSCGVNSSVGNGQMTLTSTLSTKLSTNQQKSAATCLSLSNTNLITLPEVMTLNDFSATQQQAAAGESDVKVMTSGTRTSSLLQRRGSNHSLALNLFGGGNNLNKGLSASNYSLCSILPPPLPPKQQTGINKKGPSHRGGGACAEKKNLLQRRGSNTSLTLNLHGSSTGSHLNRFNSHNSLNIGTSGAFKIQPAIKDCKTQSSLTTRKSLLERRGSNASLTLNFQSNSLTLRSSACSLSSVNTTNTKQEEEEEEDEEDDPPAPNNNTLLPPPPEAALGTGVVGKQRKFFSSENLNNSSQYSKLNTTHTRNSTKTCFGSVSDLKTHCQLPRGPPTTTTTVAAGVPIPTSSDSSFVSNFLQQSHICSCTGLRNITTRPLSPQTTSEDFKMYLANVQFLQNATNVLDGYDLMKLNYVFEMSYKGLFDMDMESSSWPFFDIDIPDEDERKRVMGNLHQEFWNLPTNHQEKPMVFGSQAKNRYKSILPNEHSRVQLIAEEEGAIDVPYINANYIKGPDFVRKCYIATQGPLPNTIYDFWLMIFQNIRKYDKNTSSSSSSTSTTQQIFSEFNDFDFDFERSTTNNRQQKIIMLTNFVENNRQKCATYFPINENDIYLITFTNDEINNADINLFYNEYFRKYETSKFNYESFEIEINDKNLISYLPNVNYFIVKNNQVLVKNGFSIRKLQCLFCCNSRSQQQQHQLARGSYTTKIDSSKDSSDASDANASDKRRKQIIHSFKILHYWYPDWPDHRSPSDISVLLEISRHMLALENIHDQPLPIIHCSAGIGRTGCMAAILNAICQIRSSLNFKSIVSNEDAAFETKSSKKSIKKSSVDTSISSSLAFGKRKLIPSCDAGQFRNKSAVNIEKTELPTKLPMTSPNINVDILGIVCNLRLQRGGMVQNSEQYELIHRAMCLYFKKILKFIHEAKM